ncbi:C5a anaphylatoxin chemotactic receptor 1 [Boleophthalmus pectinirostris]|uniref:C5a anaphylatoxin chemotactic receptor 1 n=1 Tax=Boleophthalmus pectinirostris TaxID=150288 RepID=UPI000A1C3713|nr:C5a anaphylatoxin chemotactic receptor 1 [Boleophthalmus pectinirostris]
MEDYNYDYNTTDYIIPDILDGSTVKMTPAQIISLVCYSIVILLGVPGNALVVWVTGFCMPHSVTSLWFLNLALADLLCCLSLPLLMVPLAHDDHWPFGPLACTMIKGLFYLVMYCSILQLVLISVDRYLLVTKPVWCQNMRRPRKAAWVCVLVWGVALIGSIPQFIFYKEVAAGLKKKECSTAFPKSEGIQYIVYSFRFLMGFAIPFLVIAVCHWRVYKRAESGLTRTTRSKRTLKIIVAVIVSFFICWIPLHIVDFILLDTPRHSPQRPKVFFAHTLALCLAYVNSCLNPLLYVCLGRGFKNRMSQSLRGVLNFATEEPQKRASVTNTTESRSLSTKEMTQI